MLLNLPPFFRDREEKSKMERFLRSFFLNEYSMKLIECS
jgi:hypothetical protein